eukprot:TRINITY_DN10476_c0_g1_i1.p5 TRINITY_DN10476_c0_g1~~TRINITY_DN10476_c0_g1_i1.p5  ORF type:complete len:104 (-),score=8.24 TRINITY_DN10476_c0_g1_i1:3401-3712(-)
MSTAAYVDVVDGNDNIAGSHTSSSFRLASRYDLGYAHSKVFVLLIAHDANAQRASSRIQDGISLSNRVNDLKFNLDVVGKNGYNLVVASIQNILPVDLQYIRP